MLIRALVVLVTGLLGVFGTFWGLVQASPREVPDGPRFVYLVPWEWVEGSDPHWRCPGGNAIGALDLRSLPAQAIAGGPGGPAVCVYKEPQVFNAQSPLIGIENLDLGPTKASKDRLNEQTVRQLSGTSTKELLWELFTTQSDPSGQTGPRPLKPNREGKLELHLGGFSLIASEELDWDTSTGQKVRQALQLDYAQIRTQYPRDTYLRYLGGLAQQYGLDYHFFLGDSPDEGVLPPHTRITDNFNRTDSDTLGTSSQGGWSWVEDQTDTDIDTNRAFFRGPSTDRIRANYNLSSVDHYAEAVFTTSGTGAKVGPSVRFSGAPPSDLYLYLARIGASSRHEIAKIIAGTSTSLFTDNTNEMTNGDTVRLTVTGSSLSGTVNTVQRISGTDTAITTGLQTGLENFTSAQTSFTGTADDFVADDSIALTVTQATPIGYNNDRAFTVTLVGTDFRSITEVVLERSGESSVTCASEAVQSTTSMTAVCNLDGIVPGTWDVRVTRDIGTTAVGAGILRVDKALVTFVHRLAQVAAYIFVAVAIMMALAFMTSEGEGGDGITIGVLIMVFLILMLGIVGVTPIQEALAAILD